MKLLKLETSTFRNPDLSKLWQQAGDGLTNGFIANIQRHMYSGLVAALTYEIMFPVRVEIYKENSQIKQLGRR